MKRSYFLVATFLAVVPTGPAPAQAADAATIDRLTARAVKHLTTMSRFAYKADAYGDVEFGKNFGYRARSGYFGETTGVVRSTEVRTDLKTGETFGLWSNDDRLVYCL